MTCDWHRGVGCDDPKCCPGCTCPRDESPVPEHSATPYHTAPTTDSPAIAVDPMSGAFPRMEA
jgi:hypothetical protein